MKISYDASVDAAYIDLSEYRMDSEFGYSYACDPLIVKGQIHLNFDVTGRLIGIEILQASKKMPIYLLKDINLAADLPPS